MLSVACYSACQHVSTLREANVDTSTPTASVRSSALLLRRNPRAALFGSKATACRAGDAQRAFCGQQKRTRYTPNLPCLLVVPITLSGAAYVHSSSCM